MRRRIVSFAALIVLAPMASVFADDTRDEFWPELNMYNVVGRAKLHLSARIETTPAEDYAQGKFGVAVDLRLKDRVYRMLEGAGKNVAHDRASRFSGRVGYLYGSSLDDGGDAYEEHRIPADLTGRFELPGRVLVTDRNRAEFRWLPDEYSFRYRNRAHVERDASVRGYEFTPYGAVEVFYDSRYDEFSRVDYAIGLHAPITTNLSMNTYFLRRDDDRSSSEHTNVLGVVVDLSR